MAFNEEFSLNANSVNQTFELTNYKARRTGEGRRKNANKKSYKNVR